MKKISTVNGHLLYRGISSGIKNLLEYQDKLDEINVFPVPDGDTGTNMCFTLMPILEAECQKSISDRADRTLKIIADTALDSARGNSGTIIAQWFHGLSKSAVEKETLDIKDIALAFRQGYSSAKNSLLNPQEGTIITVMRALAEKAQDLAADECTNYNEFLYNCYTASEESLQETKKILKILKKTDVVDAGALGLVLILQGILHIIQKGSKIQTTHLDISYEHSKIEALKKDIDFTIHNKFCTECIIRSESGIDKKELKLAVKDFGDSMVVAGSDNRIKIHIHTNEPASFFQSCEKFGTIHDRKADDMTKQEQATHHEDDGTDVAILADSGADIPNEYIKDVHIVPLRYSFGTEQHLDKLTQSTQEFYNSMNTNQYHPKTSQATPRDFKKTYNFVASHHNSIISIQISQQVSGTYASAINASKAINSQISIVDSCSVSVGQGLLAMYAVDLKSQGTPYKEIVKKIENIKNQTEVFVAINNLDYIVRGGRLPSIVQKLTNLFNIRPILGTTNEGKIKLDSFLLGQSQMVKKFSNKINTKIKSKLYYRLLVAHSDCKDDAKELLSNITSKNTNILSSYIVEMGCALGVHAGPGSLVVGLQELDKNEI